MNSEAPKPDLRGVRALVLFGGAQLLGQERANLEVFRTLAGFGLEARFITHRKRGGDEIQPELDRLGFGWTTAPFGYHWTRKMAGAHFGYFLLNLYGLVANSWRVWREVRRWRPTHLYVTHWETFSLALPALLWVKVPLIYRAGDELPVHSAFHRWLTRRLAHRVTRMVCVSKFILESCVAAGVPRERMQVIYSHPSARKQAEPPELPTVPPGALVLAYAGQISEHKGVGLLLDAVRRMVGRGDNIVLWAAGKSDWGSDLLEQLKQRAQEAGLAGRVHFFGYVADVSSVLEHCDVHVCPSLFPDPLPNVVNEAKQHGKPSVVFPAGGIPELIVHEVDGYICRDSSVEALMEGVAYFLADAARREAAGAAARKSLGEKFGREKYQREWAGVFLKTKDGT
jgi:glycosyltransferase involved in cell wall biosynthesis